ncbi:MAG: nucleotide exchange factor GrpE [Gammaproteobacteria bacterium]|nr:nucleotide exchange factor GrpE [Gammaproteobacteria bacterium]
MSHSESSNGKDKDLPASEATVEDNVVNLEDAGSPAAEQEAESLETAQARADENWDKFLRVSAELDNSMRRAARDVQHARKFALEKFAAEIIGVRDSLELGVEASTSSEATVDSLREGSEMTLRLLSSTLEKFGISEIDPEGEPFDPEFHEAMSMQESSEAEPNSVLKVIQKGYKLNDRLLRPARVIVATAARTETG